MTMADEPIDELNYVAGLTVVNIEDLRISRGKTRRPYSACPHLRLVFDKGERRIWCKDCEHDVDSFDAFANLAERADAHWKRIADREEQIAAAEKFVARGRAAKEMESAWRSRDMVPCCPHCGRGIFVDDVVNGVSMISKAFAARQNGRKERG